MLPTTTRAHRSREIRATGRRFFDSDEDYYFYQHLNDRVQLWHTVGFLVAVVVFVISIARLSLALFVLQYLISTGTAIAAHWVHDGFVPSGPVKTPGRVLVFGIRKNLGFLFGRFRQRQAEAEFLRRYPFAAKTFIAGLVALLFCGAFTLPAPARADTWSLEQRTELQLSAYGRAVNQFGLSAYDRMLDGWVILDHALNARAAEWELFARPELRLVASAGVRDPHDSVSWTTSRGPARRVNTQWKLFQGSSGEGYFDFQELGAAWRGEAVQATVGRRIVSLGVLRALPVWNKFSRPLPTVVGPALVFGADSVDLRYQKTEWAARLLDVEDSAARGAARLAQGTWYSPDGPELHLLGGSWWRATVIGAAAALDVKGTTFRFEGLHIGSHDTTSGKRTGTQLGFGVERAFGENWSALFEGLYQSWGSLEPATYEIIPGDPFQVLRARGYGYALLQRKLGAFLNLGVSGFLNLVDGSFFAQLRGDYNFSDTAQFFAAVNGPLGPEGTELSADGLSLAGGRRLGVEAQLFAGVQLTF